MSVMENSSQTNTSDEGGQVNNPNNPKKSHY